MEIKTLEQLTERDPTLAVFGRLEVVTDVDGRQELVPRGVTLESIQRMVADCDLASEVPDYVQDHFGTCRALHTYGYFSYAFFTAVVQRVYTTLEAALGARFLAAFPNGIELEKKGVAPVILRPSWFEEVSTKLRKRWRLKGHPRFNGREFDGSMSSLLAWARAEGLLYGQRNRVVEDAILSFRNAGAHPHGPHRISQNESADAIYEVAEIINHLWGHDTPGGRLYGGPVEMA